MRAAALLAALLAAAGCASFGSPGADSEVTALERQVRELKRRATVSEMEVARLKQEITVLEEQLERAQQAAARPAPRAATPPAAPAPRIEESDLEAPPIEPAPAPRPSAPDAAPAPGDAGPPSEAVQDDAQRLYDEAYTLFHQQRYADAETRFRNYVDLYPRNELSDNALFWIGECRYARGEYSSALDAFSETVDRYPEGNKVGDALLKAGKCLEALGDLEQAKRTYEELIRRLPATAAAVLAGERLAALRSQPAG